MKIIQKMATVTNNRIQTNNKQG